MATSEKTARFITKPPRDRVHVRFSREVVVHPLPGGQQRTRDVTPKAVVITDAGVDVTEEQAQRLREHPRFDLSFLEVTSAKQSEKTARLLEETPPEGNAPVGNDEVGQYQGSAAEQAAENAETAEGLPDAEAEAPDDDVAQKRAKGEKEAAGSGPEERGRVSTLSGAAAVLVNERGIDLEDLKNKDGSLSITKIRDAAAAASIHFPAL